MSAINDTSPPVVLVAEDEVWVLLDVAGALEEQGYSVVCARNGDEALDLFQDRDDIALVFTDINMPGSLDGLELAREVRRRRDIPVLITSGRYREIEGMCPGDFIPKPYEPRTVISRIERLTDSGTGEGELEDCARGNERAAPPPSMFASD